MSQHKNNGFNNFAILSAELSDIEVKDSAGGKKYKQAKATLLGITYKGKDEEQYHPTITLLAFNGAKKHCKPGRVKILGNLSYSEWKNGDGETISQVKVIASFIEPEKTDAKPKAYCKLTLRIGKDAETRMSNNTGQPWVSARASLSMGKDEDGDYRPSLWLNLKAFTRQDESNIDFVYEVGDLVKGEYIDAAGGLTCDEYKGRLNWGVFLNTDGFEFHDFDDTGEDAGDEEEVIEGAEALEGIPD
jgi:hypothetical protein